MTISPRAPHRFDALLAEDVITPMHHHVEGQDFLVAHTPDGPRQVTPAEADAIASECSLVRDHSEVEIDDDGPVGLLSADVRRRTFLGGAAVGLGALLATSSKPRYAFAAGATGRDTLVVIFLRGGMDGLSAVVPVTDSSYYDARSSIAVRDSSVIPLNDSFGLHPAMAALQPMWRDGHLAAMLGTGNPGVTRSHFVDQVTAERAAPAQLRSGWVARHLASSSSSTGTFRAITMGNAVTTSLTTNAFEALAMTDIARFDINASKSARADVLRTLDTMYQRTGGEVNAAATATLAAVDGLTDLRTTNAFASDKSANYPNTPFGTGLRDIARLIKAGKGLEAACIDLGGWDHHRGLTDGNAGATFAELARELADGLAAFRIDLGDAWSQTSVVTMSEFGRRVAENGTNGTDHGHGGLMFFAGGGVKGGLYGSQPTLTADNLTEGDVPILHDYRSGLAELVTKRLANGDNLATIFPDYTPTMPGIFA